MDDPNTVSNTPIPETVEPVTETPVAVEPTPTFTTGLTPQDNIIQQPQEPVLTGANHDDRNPDGTFKAGVSGNPAGKPKGIKSLTTLVREELEKMAIDENITYAELLARKIAEALVKGKMDTTLLKLAWNYLDGMPLQKVQVNPPDVVPSSEELAEMERRFIGKPEQQAPQPTPQPSTDVQPQQDAQPT